MADLLQQASQWLEGMRSKHAASPVTYRRGVLEAVVNATAGRTEYELTDDYGLRMPAIVADFLIAANDLMPVFGQPQVGDQIVVASSVYEVLSLAGQGSWRWSDPYCTTLRIHTKQVAADSGSLTAGLVE